jgi:PhnB protein
MTNESWVLAPYLHVDDARAAIDWYVRVLGATELERYEMDNGKIGHAELDVHGNKLCLADMSPGPRPNHYDEVPITLYAVVPDVDAVFNRAIEAGATVDRPLADQSYGHRNGGFVDPFGHVWYVSTPIAAATP